MLETKANTPSGDTLGVCYAKQQTQYINFPLRWGELMSDSVAAGHRAVTAARYRDWRDLEVFVGDSWDWSNKNMGIMYQTMGDIYNMIWLVVWNILLFFHILGIIIPTD